ncbi:class 1 fructose-bisphosphatase [Stratiformator vulcanicus]|uniref:Fructose-1,6-bisphosphatase class 1 n=1 Tax=Stratiformator vulcanicus TaxID=2527980 RepID=A0A517QXJ0_9PLAN|nr:class 1 fructose-bisphosphatase [Stratiformator vulcanicus]QDT36290.1 Fructose-1,6-bisphosphatase class 1 [Stratiformator vulcanicus]
MSQNTTSPNYRPESTPLADRGFVTVQQHILSEQTRFPGASGEFSWLLSGITLATKLIANKVRLAGLNDMTGRAGAVNVQGEQQQKLDVYADGVLAECLAFRESIGMLVSEESEHPLVLREDASKSKYAVVFDPLDGSSNIDVGVSVGTTFSVFHKPDDPATANDPAKWALQAGSKQVAAGYVVYGSSTILVYSVGNGVHGFTLDPSIGAFLLSHENMQMPQQGRYYSTNEAYRDRFPPHYGEYIDMLRRGELGYKYSSRYIGSLVADFHRTLLRGGVFLYPPTTEQPDGKLRLLYEANTIAFLAEQAGGVALSGDERTVDIVPTDIHQRVPLVVGSKMEMDAYQRMASGG